MSAIRYRGFTGADIKVPLRGSDMPFLLWDVAKTLFVPTTPRELAAGISVVIPFRDRGRRDQLLTCIDRIVSIAAPVEVVVVEDDAKPALSTQVFAGRQVKHIFVENDDASTAFNKPRCINVGVAASMYGNVCIHDGDILPENRYFQEADLSLRQNDACYLLLDVFYMASSVADAPDRRWVLLAPMHPFGFSMCITKKAFVAMGGADEAFSGWGADDYEFYDRASKSLRVDDRRRLYGIHLHHPMDHANYGHNSAYAAWATHQPVSERSANLRSILLGQYGDLRGVA